MWFGFRRNGGSGLIVEPVHDRRLMQSFISLPWRIYRGDPRWVPPLLRDAWQNLRVEANPLLSSGPHRLFLASRDGRPVGRLCAGVNHKLNAKNGTNDGYLTMFECIAESEVAAALFDRAADYLLGHGTSAMRGPVSPTNGDEHRGILIEGFEHRPRLFQAYNPPYYRELFECCGFVQEMDYVTFACRLDEVRERERGVDYAKRRYGFRTDALDMRNLDRDLSDIATIMAESMPTDWIDMAPPTLEEVRLTGTRLKAIAVPELVRIARAGDRPIGVAISLPDYNRALAAMNGRLFPMGWLKFMLGRRKIDAVLMFVLFVIPEFQKRGVPQTLYYDSLIAARRLGYSQGEASSVAEWNAPMVRDALSAGAQRHKAYRIYKKAI